jgi:hypothetical protein
MNQKTEDKIVEILLDAYKPQIRENKGSLLTILMEDITLDDRGNFQDCAEITDILVKKEEDIDLYVEKLVKKKYRQSYRTRIKNGETAVFVCVNILGDDRLITTLKWFPLCLH